jgi:hypothetical protein
MATIQDFFNTAAGDDTTVVADTAAVTAAQKTLDAATTTDVNDHSALTAAVVSQGPTLVTATLADGSTEFVALLPQPDGSIQTTVLFDGSKVPAAPPMAKAPAVAKH